MKSAVDDNLGFAIPIDQLEKLIENPNPVSMKRWVRLGTLDPSKWTPVFGASWTTRGGVITAKGSGSGFGGRSLLLSKKETPKPPYEISVDVRLDDESGAAGIVFHSDGDNKHYGFYPSAGRMRLTCFKGPVVYSWQVLEDIASEHYLEGQFNRLRVRVLKDRLECFVNGKLVITSTDKQIREGQIGLCKFRSTEPEFRRFQVGKHNDRISLSDEAMESIVRIFGETPSGSTDVSSETLQSLNGSPVAIEYELKRRVSTLTKRIDSLHKVANEIRRQPIYDSISELLHESNDVPGRLFHAAMLIAKVDQPDLDIDVYLDRVTEIADEIRTSLKSDATPQARKEALDQYLFEENGYCGGRAEYYHPANSHLNRVIDDREGLPITLSILYMEIARRLDLDVVGIGLPGHFVVRFRDGETSQLIDVFERGKEMSSEDASEDRSWTLLVVRFLNPI